MEDATRQRRAPAASRGGRRRRGFSLLELTIAIAIMGIMMTVAAVAFLPKILGAKKSATANTMQTVQNALNEYKAQNNTYPEKLADLAPAFLQNPPLDGWERQFYYQVPGSSGTPFDLISAGDDGEFGTKDDLDLHQPETLE